MIMLASGRTFTVVITGEVPPGIDDERWRGIMANGIALAVAVSPAVRQIDITVQKAPLSDSGLQRGPEIL